MPNWGEIFRDIASHWSDIIELGTLVYQIMIREDPAPGLDPPRLDPPPLGGVVLPRRPVRQFQEIVRQRIVHSVMADRVLAGVAAGLALAQATARSQQWAQILEALWPVLAFAVIRRLARPPVIHPPNRGPRPRNVAMFTVRDEDNRIKYAASSMQGLCSHMEDACATILDLDGSRSTSFFGVYDGHGGANIALYCANRFHVELLKDEEYHNNLDNAVEHVFFRIDEQLREYADWRAFANTSRCGLNSGTPYTEGSTACVALIRGNQIIVGSVGDSRCVLSRSGRAMDLSTDHKPNLPDEYQRIQDAGGHLTTFWWGGEIKVLLRCSSVNEILAMSRAIGDFQLKSNNDLLPTEQMVTCNPDIRSADITDDTEFLPSDGIWDILSSQGAVDFVSQNLASGMTDLQAICENLLTHCLQSRDNSTVILVQFKPAARIPLPPPASAAVPDAGTSSAANPDASTEAKTDTGSETE